GAAASTVFAANRPGDGTHTGSGFWFGPATGRQVESAAGGSNQCRGNLLIGYDHCRPPAFSATAGQDRTCGDGFVDGPLAAVQVAPSALGGGSPGAAHRDGGEPCCSRLRS